MPKVENFSGKDYFQCKESCFNKMGMAGLGRYLAGSTPRKENKDINESLFYPFRKVVYGGVANYHAEKIDDNNILDPTVV